MKGRNAGMTCQPRNLLALVLVCITSTCSLSQTASTAGSSRRPKVGLVLQGGGALGLAYVGVITWLEEHHIPVDYIAGTSMGGLVGGVYATGHNAAEMRQIVNGIPWDQVMAGTTPFQDLSSAASRTLGIIPTAQWPLSITVAMLLTVIGLVSLWYVFPRSGAINRSWCSGL